MVSEIIAILTEVDVSYSVTYNLSELKYTWILQGHPTQTVFFETALKDRNMQV